jgi:hypothetical protein
MSEIPYAVFTGKISKYFAKIQEAGIPEKVDTQWLSSMGFRSGNDSYILRVLDFIGFVDNSKKPTDLWKKYKDPTTARAVLAQAIQTGYSDLFDTYRDAHRKDREALYAYFSSRTGKAKTTVDLMVTTFTNLCRLADFEAVTPELKPELVVPSPVPPVRIEKGIPEIHINIQLHLPPTTDPTVFDNLFKSMKKHLLSAEE